MDRADSSESLVRRLARIVDYPVEEIATDGGHQAFVVDGYRVEADEKGEGAGRALLFTCALEVKGERIVDLTKFAAGRLLRETATLAYDAEKKSTFLWDEIGGVASDGEIKTRFGAFLNSCDWWRDRAKELEEKPMRVDELVIRP